MAKVKAGIIFFLLVLCSNVSIGCKPSLSNKTISEQKHQSDKIVRVSMMTVSQWHLSINKDGSGYINLAVYSHPDSMGMFSKGTFDFNKVLDYLLSIQMDNKTENATISLVLWEEGQTMGESQKYQVSLEWAKQLFEKAIISVDKKTSLFDEIQKKYPVFHNNKQ